MPRTETVLVPTTDHLTSEMLRLLTTAAQVLALHVDDDKQHCRLFGACWPCPRAELAAFTLEAV